MFPRPMATRVFEFLPLILLTLIYTAACSVTALHHGNSAEVPTLLWPFLNQLFVACWVYFDRRALRVSVPYEFDAFVYFAWPVVLPYYLCKTRGARGLLLAGLFYALFIVPALATVILRATHPN